MRLNPFFGSVVLVATVIAACSSDTSTPLPAAPQDASLPSEATPAIGDADSVRDARFEDVTVADASLFDGGQDGSSADAMPDAGKDAAAPPGPLAFVFAGESNSGGVAPNRDATAAELAPRPAVQIMNLYSGTFAFEPLDIGFNNIIDHAGISTSPTYVPNPPHGILVHGMELGLANAVEAGRFGQSRVYLIKTGQGGSKIAEWDAAGAYWSKFLQRTNAARAVLPANTRWVVWYSQGINDAIAGTPIAAWKAATVAHLAKIKSQLPGCQIILTEFQSMPANGGYPAVNAAIREIVAADTELASISTVGADTVDANHWSYAGYRNMVVPALITKTKL
jgi:Carbohydrate esterase, sialic acid-specific acetylesterase